MGRLRVTLLGGVGFRFDSGQTAPLQGRKAQALLAYLALQRGQAQPRDKLAALLWPEARHERARHNLRQLLLAAYWYSCKGGVFCWEIEPVFDSRSRFRYMTHEVTDRVVP